jgi:hypothetical protein
LSRKQPLVVVLIRARIFEELSYLNSPKILSRKALHILCTHDARLVVFFVFSFCFWGFFVLVEEPLLLLCFLVSIEFEAQSSKDEQQQQHESVLVVVGEFP